MTQKEKPKMSDNGIQSQASDEAKEKGIDKIEYNRQDPVQYDNT